MVSLKSKGVDAVYCLSVNDKHVMRAWAENTSGCRESGINLIADGNGEYVSALGLTRDATGSRMGKIRHRNKNI
jgi:peroxiredoxin